MAIMRSAEPTDSGGLAERQSRVVRVVQRRPSELRRTARSRQSLLGCGSEVQLSDRRWLRAKEDEPQIFCIGFADDFSHCGNEREKALV
jgi:hypothetical protein